MSAVSEKCCPNCGGHVAPVDLLINKELRTITHQGVTATLTAQQFAVFDRLFHAFPSTVRRGDLHEACGTESEAEDDRGSRIVEVVITRLRHKLEGSGIGVENVRGVGYRLAVDEGAHAELRRAQRVAQRPARDAFRMEDVGLVGVLRGQGFGVTAIAQRTGLTYRAVSAALDALQLAAPAASNQERAA